jgi:nucleoside-diphosphate-sugar epimerase
MIKLLITGAGSYVGESVRNYILSTSSEFKIDTIDTLGDNWKKADYTIYDAIFHVAGIAHVNANPKMKDLYYKVNRDLAIEVANHAKTSGVKYFIFMSSQIVFHESKNLRSEVLTRETPEKPNGFYGDSKLQAEIGLHKLENDNFKVCILRPPMIYGPKSKGNFPRLAKLATITPIFPAYHNKRSMLYIDNLSEFVKQALLRQISGVFYPQNRELSDTVEIIRYFAKAANHKIWISSLFNPLVYLCSPFLQVLNKMFATYYYDPDMSKVDFDYQKVSFYESLKRISDTLKK